MGDLNAFNIMISEGILPPSVNPNEDQYLCLMRDIIHNGYNHDDRTGAGRRSVFGRQLRFKMQDGFPLITTRKIYTKAMIHELLWFISGSKNNMELNSVGVHIWDKWAISHETAPNLDDEEYNFYQGSIGNIYGPSWRNAPGSIDQLMRIVDQLKNDPFSSRHVLSAWIPEWIPLPGLPLADNIRLGKGALAPCHVLQQYMVREQNGVEYLSLLMFQR